MPITSADQCVYPSKFFQLMEFQREKLPAMTRKSYAPIFLVNLLKEKLFSDSHPSSSSTGTGSTGTNNFGMVRRKRVRIGMDCDSDNWTHDDQLDFEGIYFMSEENRSFAERVLLYAVEIKNTAGIGLDSVEFLRLFCQEVEFPCLELLWLMDNKFKLMGINAYLMRFKTKSQIDYFINQFVAFCFSPCLLEDKTRIQSTEMLQDILRNILIAGYCNPDDNGLLVSLKKLAVNILTKVQERLISMSVESPSYQNLHLLIAMFRTVPVAVSTKRRYFSEELNRILTLESDLTLQEVLQQQEKIAEIGVKNSSLAETIAMLIGEPQTKIEVIRTLEKSLIKPEKLNWENLLATITVWEKREFSSTRIMSLLKEAIKRLLVSSLTEGNTLSLLSAFALARHCCLIAPQRFSRYEEWYTSLFEKEFTTCAREKELFNFLVKSLTEIVSIEPPCFLQAHAAYPPFIPVGCDEIWSDYLALVRLRITEYHEVEDAMEYEPNPENPIQHDVDVSIKIFDKTKTIPKRISEMLMFRRHYYLESFLPALIKKPLTTAVSDARLRLIETLNASGKIPHKQYAEYKAQNQNKRN